MGFAIIAIDVVGATTFVTTSVACNSWTADRLIEFETLVPTCGTLPACLYHFFIP